MLLGCDIGNSNIVLGIFNDDQLIKVFRVNTDRNLSYDQYEIVIKNLFISNNLNLEDIKNVAISSTVPSLIEVFIEVSRKLFDVIPLVVEPGLKTGLILKMDNPVEVGADLIVAAVAGISLYGAPLVIVDLGTATTLTYISANNTFEGGIIIPGIKNSMDALIKSATQLPQVKFEAPKQLIGKNTKDAMNSGSVYGTISMIDGLISKIQKEVKASFKIIATGGLANRVINYTEQPIILDENLVLKGLNIIYKKNRRIE